MEKNQTMTDEQLARELQNGKRGGGRGKLLTVIGCAATAIGIFTSVTALTVIGIVVALLGQGVLNKHQKATGKAVFESLVPEIMNANFEDVQLIGKRNLVNIKGSNIPLPSYVYDNASGRIDFTYRGLTSELCTVTLTDVDEENILLSLFAKEHAPKIKSITKVNNTTFDEVINKLDLDSIIYPKYVTAEYIVRYVRAMKNTIGSNVETLYRLVNNRVEALEFVIRQSSPILDIPLEKLSLKKNLLIASIYRDGVLIMPNGQDVMSIGDKVIVVTTNQGLDDISDIVKER